MVLADVADTVHRKQGSQPRRGAGTTGMVMTRGLGPHGRTQRPQVPEEIGLLRVEEVGPSQGIASARSRRIIRAALVADCTVCGWA